ncbi:MAG TPA: hypothetical protein VM901_12225 [Bdellovibrionota bacterium]|nr:hypothetical protein [Bdellovibrionota bacterium]
MKNQMLILTVLMAFGASAQVPSHDKVPEAKTDVVPAEAATPNAKAIRSLIDVLKKNGVDALEAKAEHKKGGDQAALAYINSKVAAEDKGKVMMGGLTITPWVNKSFKPSLKKYEAMDDAALLAESKLLQDNKVNSDDHLASLMSLQVAITKVIFKREANGLKDLLTTQLQEQKTQLGKAITDRYQVDADYFIATVIK